MSILTTKIVFFSLLILVYKSLSRYFNYKSQQQHIDKRNNLLYRTLDVKLLSIMTIITFVIFVSGGSNELVEKRKAYHDHDIEFVGNELYIDNHILNINKGEIIKIDGYKIEITDLDIYSKDKFTYRAKSKEFLNQKISDLSITYRYREKQFLWSKKEADDLTVTINLTNEIEYSDANMIDNLKKSIKSFYESISSND